MLHSTLTTITLVIVVAVILVLVAYLALIILALRKAGDNLSELAVGLSKIKEDSAPLNHKVGTINGALDQLHQGLASVDGHLIEIAKVLRLVS